MTVLTKAEVGTARKFGFHNLSLLLKDTINDNEDMRPNTHVQKILGDNGTELING